MLNVFYYEYGWHRRYTSCSHMLLICGEVLESIGRPRTGASEMLVSNRIAYSLLEGIKLPLLICVRRSSVNVSKTYAGCKPGSAYKQIRDGSTHGLWEQLSS